MMENLSRYVLCVIGTAMIVAVLGSLPLEGSPKKLLRLAGGLLLTLVLVRPVLNWDWGRLGALGRDFIEEGRSAAAEGAARSKEEERAIIKSRTEAYILDKAAACQASLGAEVHLGEGEFPVPESVTLTGTVNPYAKARLSRILEDELGIPKEQQQWKN